MMHPVDVVDDVAAVRRPSRVCFDDASHPLSPAAAACKPMSSAVQLRTRPVTSSSATTVPSVTPVDAQPSSVQQLDSASYGGSQVPSDGWAAAGGDTSSVVHPYLVELIRTTVQDEVEEIGERLHRDITNMHMDMLIRIDALQV